MKLSQIKENLLIEEEVTQNILTEIDTISDPSNLLMGIFGMIIDHFSIGNFDRSLLWEKKCLYILTKYKDKNCVKNEVMGFEHNYLCPFIISLKNKNPDFLQLKMYLNELKKWAHEYYKNKIPKECNESVILCSIILNENIELNEEISPLAKRYINCINSGNNEKEIKELYKRIKQRIKNEGSIHVYSIIYLMAYYTLCGKGFTLYDYIDELFENDFLKRD